MIPVRGAIYRYENHLRQILGSLPSWYVIPARISRISVSSDPEVARQVAAYAHGTRNIQIAPGVGTLLERSLTHEIAHGLDDGAPNESAHRFSRSPGWMAVHRQAQGFEIPKYRDEPQEYFADMMSKFVLYLAGSQTGNSLQRSHPREYEYIVREVVPALMRESTGKA